MFFGKFEKIFFNEGHSYALNKLEPNEECSLFADGKTDMTFHRFRKSYPLHTRSYIFCTYKHFLNPHVTGDTSDIEFATMQKSLAKCPADPPATGNWAKSGTFR